MLYNADLSQDSCGVGFITRKDGKQTHDLLKKSHEALRAIPRRGGMSAEGIGDGLDHPATQSQPRRFTRLA